MGLREDYLKASKREKTILLDEYIKNTGQNRKYVIQTLNGPEIWADQGKRRKPRKNKYGPEVNAPLVLLWRIFDFPCGQRLKPCIEAELERLRDFGEINISDQLAEQLKSMSSATIDRRLKVPRKGEHNRRFSTTRPGSLLKAKIPIRLTTWDTKKIGYLETDLVAHCGASAFGEYGNTVSLTEIAVGWWEGEAILGKTQKATLEALKLMRLRTPFTWLGLDADNGGEFINYPLWNYCNQEKLEFTRSRENKKNDNAYVEQKNWTHVRKMLGYLRYDTPKELAIINNLYRTELRLYKNFFQPIMKLKKKMRLGAKRHRQYEVAKTPYQRLTESKQIKQPTRNHLTTLYQQLNPAALKRTIDRKLYLLYQTHQSKRKNSIKRTLPRREVISVRS